MALERNNPTKTKAWRNLKLHFEKINNISMQDMFQADSQRSEKMSILWNDFFIDFSKNRLTDETLNLLISLANEINLEKEIKKYFEGDIINETEGRAVLHTALRANKEDIVKVNNENIIPTVYDTRIKIQKFTDEILKGGRKGYSNKYFTDIVNIGIGGSDLGPVMVVEALKYYKKNLNTHFISNIDGDHVHEIINNLNPETTLFIIVSKTFTTQETLTNSETIKKWFLRYGTHEDISKHFVAVSSNIKKATEFGIDKDDVFPMWDWVGGRFSLWSAVGLSINLAIGNENFEKLLSGAHEMDKHFKTVSLDKNIPVILALISVWYNNFYNAETESVIAYSQYLQKFAPYLQQGIMESNGKNIDRDGNKINYQTGTVIWGEPGSNAQHAFFQLIHQGTKLIPTDFIGFIKPLHSNIDHHNKLMSNFFAQTEALLKGKSKSEVSSEYTNSKNDDFSFVTPFKVFEGNKPSNTILINQLTPESLGSLIALYEHKIFVQGVIWNIFSYDQWGVELGKKLANNILEEIENGIIKSHDSSTTMLINHFKANQ